MTKTDKIAKMLNGHYVLTSAQFKNTHTHIVYTNANTTKY